MQRGYVKLWRKLEDYQKFSDPDYLSIYVWLNLKAAHKQIKYNWGGRTLLLQPGQLVTGRRKLSELAGVHESKTQRVLKWLETEHLIEQQTNSTSRLITITKWKRDRKGEQ